MNEMKSTKNYDTFIIRPDNRDRIFEADILKLMSSIKTRNLLHMRPILVDKNYEVIDGNHRLMAAQRLGLEIYYKVEKTLCPKDIILLNNQKGWLLADYFNFYVFHKYPEYIKLKKFIDKNEISLRVAIYMTNSVKKHDPRLFKDGEYIFEESEYHQNFQVAKNTIEIIKKLAEGKKSWCESAKFWKALLLMVNHKNFDIEKFKINAQKKAERFGARASVEDYLKMFEVICNSRINMHIHLQDRYDN